MSVGFEVYILDYDEVLAEALSQENKWRTVFIVRYLLRLTFISIVFEL